MSKIKLGIYGGTFSPPHLGHVSAARSFLQGIGIDKLLIMPNFLPPHKLDDGFVTVEDRLAMCRLAFCDLPNTEISDFEVKKGGKSYTYLTLEAFSSKDVDLYFLCGTDMFLTLDTWKNPEIIFALATICYVRRETDGENDALLQEKAEEYRKCYSARIIPISHDAMEISSTELRVNIKNDDLLGHSLSGNVSEYIRERGLYR